MDGVEIEVFRADTRASQGLTAAHIAEAAAIYDHDKAPAPLVFGHPKSDSPALGVIAKARAEGSKLFCTLNNIAEEAVKAVRERRVLGRSIAFWDPDHPSNPNPGKFSIRHLGLLGGMAPAIPGLATLRFSADDSALEADEPPSDALVFMAEEKPTGVQNITETPPEPADKEPEMPTPEELKAREDAAAEQERKNKEESDRLANERNEFAAERTRIREAGTTAIVDGLVGAGKVLPAEKDDLATVLNALPVQALKFSAGEKDPREALVAILDQLPKRAPVGDPPKSAEGDKTFGTDGGKEAAEAALKAANAGLSAAWKPAAATA
jgi:hypothetical protein